MPSGLPAAQAAICQQLTQQWIGKRRTVDGQVDGFSTISAALWRVVEPMLGAVATRAVLSRARYVARQKQPDLEFLAVGPEGFDFGRLRTELQAGDPAHSTEVLSTLLEELLLVLHGLLRDVLLPLLREVDAELEARAGDGEG